MIRSTLPKYHLCRSNENKRVDCMYYTSGWIVSQ